MLSVTPLWVDQLPQAPATKTFWCLDVVTPKCYIVGEEMIMAESAKRSTIYLDPSLHRALRIKAVHTRRSMSELVNDAVRMAISEDQKDLAGSPNEPKSPRFLTNSF